MNQLFDSVSYEKGASVLGMLRAWLGVDAFDAGVRDYLERHAYANTTTAVRLGAPAREGGEPTRASVSGSVGHGVCSWCLVTP